MSAMSFTNTYHTNGNGHNLDNKSQEDHACSYAGKAAAHNHYHCNDIQHHPHHCYHGYHDTCSHNTFGYHSCFFGVQQGGALELDGHEVPLQASYAALCSAPLPG